MLVDKTVIKRRLAKLQPGRKTSFGYEEGNDFEAGRTRNAVLSVATGLRLKVSTHKNGAKSTIEVTRAL